MGRLRLRKGIQMKTELKEDRRLEILLAEDNHGDAHLMLKFMKGASVPNQVTVVQDGEEAMDFLLKKGKYEQAHKPDVIFLDLNMPRKDGRTVLREIKRLPELREIPVIVMTLSNWPEDVKGAYESEANFYMVKPVDLEQFLNSMKYVEEFWLKKILFTGGLASQDGTKAG